MQTFLKDFKMRELPGQIGYLVPMRFRVNLCAVAVAAIAVLAFVGIIWPVIHQAFHQ